MKTRLSLLALTLVIPIFITQPAARLGAVVQRGAPACTGVPDPEACTESMPVGAFAFWYYTSYTLNMPEILNPDVTRAVIVIHGMERNAADYFTNVTRVLNNDTDPSLVVIAPHFKGFVSTSPDCQDSRLPGELYWSCSGTTSVTRWDDGGHARNNAADAIYSFSMIDYLITNLTAKFPNLTKIVVVGHSDGAQFTQRFAAGDQTDPVAGVAIKYVVANPGSYMYLDETRLPKGETCVASGCTSAFTSAWDPDHGCYDTYNNYKYGLAARNFGYMDQTRPGFGDMDLRNQFISRRVAYVLGDLDQEPNFSLDQSCPATAQGMHLLNDGSGLIGGRRERGTIFWNYMQLQLGADPALHTLTGVPNCGHNVDWCMFNSVEMVAEIMF